MHTLESRVLRWAAILSFAAQSGFAARGDANGQEAEPEFPEILAELLGPTGVVELPLCILSD